MIQFHNRNGTTNPVSSRQCDALLRCQCGGDEPTDPHDCRTRAPATNRDELGTRASESRCATRRTACATTVRPDSRRRVRSPSDKSARPLTPCRQRVELALRHRRPDVVHSAQVRVHVMAEIVADFPQAVRRQRRQEQQPADPAIGLSVAEQALMARVVTEHEQARDLTGRAPATTIAFTKMLGTRITTASASANRPMSRAHRAVALTSELSRNDLMLLRWETRLIRRCSIGGDEALNSRVDV